MSRTGPPHYHQGSSNLCHCPFSETYHNTSAPYIYPTAPARPRPVAGHPSEYGPAIRRVPKPKPINKVAKSRDMKFDEDSWQWYFETPEAPGVKWLESVRHIEDLPQTKDSDFLPMLNEYYLSGHVINMPDQERLPVMPGGPGKSWRYKRAPPPPPKPTQQHPPAPAQPQAWAEPVYHQRYPAAPQYAGGSAHPVSMRLPSGASPHDNWRLYSASPHEYPRDARHPSGSERLGPLPGAPGPRHYVDASAHRRYQPAAEEYSDEESEEEEEEEEDESDESYDGPEDLPRSRAYIPPPSPKSARRAQKLRERGFRVVNPHTNVEPDGLEALRLDGQPIGKHGRSASAPNVLPATYEKVDIHRLLQMRTTLGVARMPDLVFDLRYDPRHAFDRSEENQKDLTTAPAFQPGQKFVRLLIRHPFGGRGGDWVEDVEDAQYLTVMGVARIISDMVHRYIDQNLDWDPLSEFDKSFVYEAYLNRPCPDEDAAGRRLHLFCEKYMFGGIEQLPPRARGTTAEGPTFMVKLIKNSKLKRYDKLSGFRIPSGKSKRWTTGNDTTFPYLDDMANSRRM